MGPEPTTRLFNSPGALWRLYGSASQAFAGLLPLAAQFSDKLAEGLAGRQGLDERLADEASKIAGCVWFHVTSVGEYEQARPVITALKNQPGAPPVAVTHFSPSGYEFARKQPCADVHEYLPFDTPAAMTRLVQLWQPRLLVFVKFDCWPNQVLAAARKGVPIILLAGSLQPRSGRLHPLVRPFFREVFDHFSHLGVCTEEDRERFTRRLGVSCPCTVTGDTRIEQVISRYEASRAGPVARALTDLGGRILVLGSTWPPDEDLWLPILPALLESQPALRIVLTPHEPLPQRLAELEQALGTSGISSLRLSQLADRAAGSEAGGETSARVILVDSVGQLAEIYRAGHLAYVGGSFTTGVHNTMEPAVAGMPVLFGPRIHNAEEAGRLVACGAGRVLKTSDQALAEASSLLADETLRQRAGQAARQFVLSQRGATAKSLVVLQHHLTTTTSSREK